MEDPNKIHVDEIKIVEPIPPEVKNFLTNGKQVKIINNKSKYYNYYGATPKYKRTFHKTQIFNHYKPFMVDDFKEYADYE